MDSLQALEMLRKQTCALASWYMKVFSPMPKRSCYKLVVRAAVSALSFFCLGRVA